MPLTSLAVFAAALGLALLGTPLVRRLALRTGSIYAPSAHTVHTRPMPLLGGLAIYAAAMLALVAIGGAGAAGQLAGILTGATLVALLGIADDRRPLAPSLKLAGQVACTLLLIASGVQVQLSGVLLTGTAEVLVDGVLTILWVVTITNAMNFMDNMDGVLGGVAAAASGSFMLLAVANGQELVAPLSAALLGASLGFLVYNFNPASIFMGDGGSLFLGFVLAALGIKLRFPGQSPHVTWMVPVLVLAVPLFDLALVVVSRSRRGVNPFTTGGQDHLSHRLVRRGATGREAALAIWLLACAAGGAAIFVSFAGRLEGWLVLAGVVVLGLGGIWRLELARSQASGTARPQTPQIAQSQTPIDPQASIDPIRGGEPDGTT